MQDNPLLCLCRLLALLQPNGQGREAAVAFFTAATCHLYGVHACAIVDRESNIIASSGKFKLAPVYQPAPAKKKNGNSLILAMPLMGDYGGSICVEADFTAYCASLHAWLEVAAALIGSQQGSESAPQVPVFGFIGSSQALRNACEQIGIVAPSHTTVLLQGESGAGKELAARAIHLNSPVKNGPFISVNCAALPESLIESELFGHERGAFTGATQMYRGKFERANGGTLFLDEIGELGPAIQAKLLRALQERSFERLGAMTTVCFDARIIAATNRDLAQMVENGSFRRDLFYRLNVFVIKMPPLRERPEDILPLASHFLNRHVRGVRFSKEAIEFMQAHDWPGNARELENAMERAALLLGKDTLLLPEHLPAEVAPPANSLPSEGYNIAQKIVNMERTDIISALGACAGRLNKAAALLGLSERQLGCRLRKYGISYKDFRQ